MVGRVLRPHPGKEHATIIDHSGAVYMHGFVEDEVKWSLDPKKPLSIKERKIERDKEEALIVCDGCFSAYSGSNICPKCGHIAEKKSQYVSVLDAELGFVDKAKRVVNKKLSYAPEFRAEFYAMLLGYCAMKDYNTGWAFHTYKNRFKLTPNYGSVEPTKPSKDCMNYIKYLQIRKAKRK
jgi:hypothetical protein